MHLRLLLLALSSLGAYLLIAVRSNLTEDERLLSNWYQASLFEASGEFLLGWVALSILYLLAVRLVSTRHESSVVAMVAIAAILFRAAMLLGGGFDLEPSRGFLHGSALDTLDLGEFRRRFLVTLCDLVALALAPHLLKAAKIPVAAIVVHAWNPLVIKEVAGSGRLELVGLVLLVVALSLAMRRRRWLASVAYGTSLGGWLALASCLPLFARTVRGKLVLGLGVALSVWGLAQPGGAWDTFSRWPPESYLGGSLTPALTALFGLFLTRDPTAPLVLALGAWGAFVLYRAARCSRDAAALPHEALVSIGGLSFVLPHVMPWLFVPLAYLGAYSANRGWVWFTLTAPLTYVAAATGEWSFMLGFAQYFVPYALLVFWWLGRPPPRKAAG